MGLSDWESKGPPAWAREPLAWAACAIDALPLAVASFAFLRWSVGVVPVLLGLGLYLAIFTGLAFALKPWMAARKAAGMDRDSLSGESCAQDRAA